MGDLNKLYEIAKAEIGYSRWNDPEQGTKYGRWYAEKTKNSYFGKSGVPYCAMFVSWCAEMAGVSFPGLPSAYCPDIHNFQNVKTNDLQFMDLVLFDWGNDRTDDHIGFFVCWIDDNTAKTIEGNTLNGKVAYRVRTKNFICGGVRSVSSEVKQETVSNALPILKFGSKCGAVQTMQELLLARGYNLDKYGADGEFGEETGKALEEFQEVCNIEADKICGAITWNRLLRL